MHSPLEQHLSVDLSTPSGEACLSVHLSGQERKTIFLGTKYDEIAIASAFIKMGHSILNELQGDRP